MRPFARLAVAFTVLAAALCGLGAMGWLAFDRLLIVHTSDGKCWRYDAHRCWDLSPEFITRATGLDLPPGTVVRDSRTAAWLSWRLSATVVLPKDVELPPKIEGSGPSIKLVRNSKGHAIYDISVVEDGQRAPWPTPR